MAGAGADEQLGLRVACSLPADVAPSHGLAEVQHGRGVDRPLDIAGAEHLKFGNFVVSDGVEDAVGKPAQLLGGKAKIHHHIQILAIGEEDGEARIALGIGNAGDDRS